MGAPAFATTSQCRPEELSANVTRILLQLGADPDRVTTTADFCEDLGLSECDRSILLLSLECRFQFVIPRAVEHQLTTIDRVVQYLLNATSR